MVAPPSRESASDRSEVDHGRPPPRYGGARPSVYSLRTGDIGAGAKVSAPGTRRGRHHLARPWARPGKRWGADRRHRGGPLSERVKLEGHSSLMGPDVVNGDPTRVAPDEAVEFLAVGTLATTDTTVTVTWSMDPTGRAVDRKQWRYPLPS